MHRPVTGVHGMAVWAGLQDAAVRAMQLVRLLLAAALCWAALPRPPTCVGRPSFRSLMLASSVS